MKGRNSLYIPGPTNVPQRIRNAIAIEQEDMRSADFPDFTLQIFQDLKSIFKTKEGRVFIFPSTGTGGLEAAISNTLSKGDKVLMSEYGQFSKLWINMAKRFGLNVQAIDVEWGEGVPVERFASILSADNKKEIKAVFVTHNETSTGVTSNLAAIRRVLDETDHPALLFVDGVSSIASINFEMDNWGVDICVTGSQKGFMLPTGLSIVCVSPKVMAAFSTAMLPRSFFSFEEMALSNDDGYFPYTPATSLLRGLRESLNMISEEGLENIFARHQRLGHAVRHAVQAWGLSLVANRESLYSNTVSAIYVPKGFDGNDLVRHAYKKYNLSLAISLGKIAGKAFRIGHLGDLNEMMVLTPIVGAEMAMKDLGIPIELASGVSAAQEYLRLN